MSHYKSPYIVSMQRLLGLGLLIVPLLAGALGGPPNAGAATGATSPAVHSAGASGVSGRLDGWGARSGLVSSTSSGPSRATHRAAARSGHSIHPAISGFLSNAVVTWTDYTTGNYTPPFSPGTATSSPLFMGQLNVNFGTGDSLLFNPTPTPHHHGRDHPDRVRGDHRVVQWAHLRDGHEQRPGFESAALRPVRGPGRWFGRTVVRTVLELR